MSKCAYCRAVERKKIPRYPKLGERRCEFAWLPRRIWRVAECGHVEPCGWRWLCEVVLLYTASGWIAYIKDQTRRGFA